MEELIRITVDENGNSTISGRELHKFLGITERFSQWCERMFGYGFVENRDYVGCKVFNTLANQELQDYAMTIDMAKEVSMVQRSEKGKQAREYFIARDKELSIIKQNEQEIDFNDPDTVLKLAQNWADEKKKRIEAEAQLQLQKPKVEYVEKLMTSQTTFSTTEVAADLGMSAIKLNKELLNKGIIRRLNTGDVLTAKYLNRGYEYMLPIQKDGQTKRQLRWTERGRAFVNWTLGNKQYTEQAQLKLN